MNLTITIYKYPYRSPQDIYERYLEDLAWAYAEHDGWLNNKADYVEGFMSPERCYPAPMDGDSEQAYWDGVERRQRSDLGFLKIYK